MALNSQSHQTSPLEDGTIVDPNARVDLTTGAVFGKKSKAERLFVARLDFILLPFLCISQVIKFLDQQNISAAYVSGMKEELNVVGVQYNLFSTFFFIGYAIFLVPSQIIMTRVRPSTWLPSLELIWGILTLAQYKAQNVETLYGLRFCIGLLESSCYPGAIMLLYAWYTPRELGFRIGLYASCQFIGTMLAGALQAAIYTNLNGHTGLSGWRWMFVINGSMTMVVALFGYILIPDYPSRTNPRASFWLKTHHVNEGQLRMAKFRRRDNKPFTVAAVVRAVKGPLFYFFVILFPACVMAQQGYNYFNLFLKALKNPDGTPVWSVQQVNAIPIGGNAITVVMLWVYSFLSDYYQTRWIPIMIQATLGLIPSIIMIVWDVPLGAKYFAFFMTYFSSCTAPPIYTWISDMLPHDPEQRAFISGFMNAFWYAVGSWSNVLIWPTYEVPHYSHAWQISLGCWLLVLVEVSVLRYYEIKVVRPRNVRLAQELYEETHQGQMTLGLVVSEPEEPNTKLTEEGNTVKVASVPELEDAIAHTGKRA
ncbi:hypothetical protein PV05_08722 [Exophiala xenobiotica]|uniref:Major facilitator superfamily (MFS) profile domain-containing protein n=1 Tax=Exophiala xenobiotica TaxID=348802 RepID=A0A0D2ECN8_9EURO|nr:uncharacterized protein PV05_08722 [Exophiala xenobiotica]KIW53128.1 hypothetical protein PV05_08722 [Exophiala xenobiotica]